MTSEGGFVGRALDSSTGCRPRARGYIEDEQALVRFFRGVVGSSATALDAYMSAPDWPARVDAVHTVIQEERAEKEHEFDAARFAGLTVPTLLLSGDESAPFLRDATDVLHDALPNSRIVSFADTVTPP